jgi:hypothetical protein
MIGPVRFYPTADAMLQGTALSSFAPCVLEDHAALENSKQITGRPFGPLW